MVLVGCFVDGLVGVLYGVIGGLFCRWFRGCFAGRFWLNVGHGFGTLFCRWFGRCLVWCNWWVVLWMVWWLFCWAVLVHLILW